MTSPISQVLLASRSWGKPFIGSAGFESSGGPHSYLSPKHDIDAVKDLRKLLECESSNTLIEKRTVNGNDLGSVCDCVFRQACSLSWKKCVTRGVSPDKVTREGHTHDSRDAAQIQMVALNHNYRATKSWSRSSGLRQIRPPDFPLRDFYHSVCSRTRRTARARNGSGPDSPSFSTTRFMASVTSSGVCRAKNSVKACA